MRIFTLPFLIELLFGFLFYNIVTFLFSIQHGLIGNMAFIFIFGAMRIHSYFHKEGKS